MQFRTMIRRAGLASAVVTLHLAIAATQAQAGAAEAGVVVTIKPVHALVAQVMDGIGSPAVLIAGQASPHSYALKPSDVRALSAAKLLFRVSEQVEPFTAKIVTALPKTVRVVTLAEANGVRRLSKRTGDTFEAHDHGSEGGETGHAGHEGEQHEGTLDGHIWLDPENAKAMVAEIARALSETWPDEAPRFRANAARATDRLDRLSADLVRDLEPLKGRPYVVFHDAYQYFERRFGLAALGAIALSPEAHPSAKRLSELRSKIAGLAAACVFAEPAFSSKLVDAVIEGTRAHAGTLDPEGAVIEPGPDAYDTLLRNLARGLTACLAPA